MSRSLAVVFLLATVILVGCAGMAAPAPHAASRHAPASPASAPSPATTASSASTDATASSASAKAVIVRGDPVVAFEGARDEHALYVPVSLALRDGRFDLIIHFHGKHQTAIDALEQSGLPAAIVNVDLGVGSTHYREAYESADALDDLIAFAELELRRSGRVSDARVGRIAISAWSAGYGAAREIVQRPTDAARVDALLLVDGFFSDWENRRAHTVDSDGLAAAMAFARRATTGEKLFVLTHTAISQRSYAGGAQSADALLRFLDVDKGPARAGQRRTGGAPQYAVDVEGLHILGFNGLKWADHVEQHRAMGALHYAELRKYWQQPTGS